MRTRDEKNDIEKLQKRLSAFFNQDVEVSAAELPIDPNVRRSIESLFGRRIVGYEGELAENTFSGLNIPEYPEAIYVSASCEHPCLNIIGHELLHSLKQDNPELYWNEIFQPMIIYFQNEIGYKEYIDDLRMESGQSKMDLEIVYEEILADTLGDNFTNPDFWSLVDTKITDSAFKQFTSYILGFIDRVTEALNPLKSDEHITDLDKARDVLSTAIAKHSEYIKGETARECIENEALFFTEDIKGMLAENSHSAEP